MNESFGTIGQAFQWMERQLEAYYPKEESSSLVYLVFRHLLQCSRIEIHERFKTNLPYSLQIRIEEIAADLRKNEPIQYILGETEFYGIPFVVKPGVLIPRPETEELVDWIIRENIHMTPLSILDVGCGSGCIAVSLAKNLPAAHVHATDISDAALSLTSENARLNGCSVNVHRHDIFSETTGIPGSPFNVIASNPPYIPLVEKAGMDANVRDHEPDIALFVPSKDPLVFYRRLAKTASHLLQPGGKMYVEIHEHFGSEVYKLFEQKDFSDITLRKDVNGKERMVSAIWRHNLPGNEVEKK